ncbi:unnamed protein product [Meloidogyne enterolobii]|uniref:Uncharacterized protein n=1 Tax=Meloidogyne enterolobii TaxID=390850 RepID=A0ACB0YMC4_MELEN
MIKIIIPFLYLIILLNIKCSGKLIKIKVKIEDDWEEKREFIYLKNVEIKERFVLKTIEKSINRYFSPNYNIDEYLHPVEINIEKNIFNVRINDRSYIPSVQLKRKVLIEIGNNEIIQNFLPGFEKRVFFIF